MAGNKPYISSFGFASGRRGDCLIGVDHMAIPVTIQTNRFKSTGDKILGPSLWVRADDASGDADRDCVPLNIGGEVSALANTTVTNGRITFRTAGEANHFRVGDTVKTFGYTSGEFLATGATVLQVSGELNVITVDTNMANIAAYDKVVVTTNSIGGGASANARAVVILEDIQVNSGETIGTKAYVKGSFNRSMIKGATFVAYGQSTAKNIFNQHDNQLLQLIDIQA
jgi:hypothetical protein